MKAIQNSPLSLSPAPEGSEVLVKLPRMTKETVEQVRRPQGGGGAVAPPALGATAPAERA
jgi:hypothetical protein